jgi:hypothetical protein
MGAPGFCSAHCDRTLSEECLVCGAAEPGSDPPGVCALGMCLPSCDAPGAELGSNGCPDPSMACYPNDGTYGGGIAFRDPAGTDPAGWCLRACASATDCELLWAGATGCDPASGVCG